MSKKNENKLVPKLRFPEFANSRDWKAEKLGSLFSERQETGFVELPLLSLTDKEGIILQEETNRKNNSNSDKSKYLRVCVGDIGYNTMRMWEGRSAFVNIEGLVSPAYTVCKPNFDSDGLFYSFYFKTPQLIQQFHRYSQGLVKDTLNLKYEAFSQIQVLAPLKSEQQKIAHFLSSLDELITAENQKLETLQLHKKGLMRQLFPAEGEKVPKLRFKEFRSSREWEIKPLGAIAENLDSRRVPITKNEREEGDIPYYGASGVIDYVKDFIFDDVLLCISEDGANLVARTYPIAFSITGKTWVNNHAHVLKFENDYTQVIVENYLDDINIEDYLTGMAQPKLNRSKLDIIPIPLPSPNEQITIANCLTSLVNLIKEQNQKVENLNAHKKGLMQQLFPNLYEIDA